MSGIGDNIGHNVRLIYKDFGESDQEPGPGHAVD